MAHGGVQAGLVLVHGAELGAWVWEPTRAHLTHPSLAVDLPGRDASAERRRSLGLDDAVAHVGRCATGWREDPLVLVVHSFSGVLVPDLAVALGRRLRAVVWIAASVPEQGRSWVALQPPGQRAVLRLLRAVRPAGVRSPAKQNLALLCNDLDPSPAAEVLGRRVPEVPGFLFGAVRGAVPEGVEHHYVRLGRDRAVDSRQAQRSIDALPGAVVHDLDAGHLPMLGRPEELAQLLDSVATAHEGSAAWARR